MSFVEEAGEHEEGVAEAVDEGEEVGGVEFRDGLLNSDDGAFEAACCGGGDVGVGGNGVGGGEDEGFWKGDAFFELGLEGFDVREVFRSEVGGAELGAAVGGVAALRADDEADVQEPAEEFDLAGVGGLLRPFRAGGIRVCVAGRCRAGRVALGVCVDEQDADEGDLGAEFVEGAAAFDDGVGFEVVFAAQGRCLAAVAAFGGDLGVAAVHPWISMPMGQ